MHRIVTAFNASVDRLELRAGAAAAKEVRACAAAVRTELTADITAAGLRAEAIERQVAGTHDRLARRLRTAARLFLALCLLLAGFVVGHFTR
jgi:hypothetical protein